MGRAVAPSAEPGRLNRPTVQPRAACGAGSACDASRVRRADSRRALRRTRGAILKRWSLAAFLAACLAPATSALAQRRGALPWSSGEYLEYDVKFNGITSGSARMQVIGLDTVRGRTAWRLQFGLSGGIPVVYRVSDVYASWIDTATLSSLRYVQRISEGNYKTTRTFEIFPERGMFVQNGKPEHASVAQPLDDASFFFFVRTIPLEVGKTYEFNRYFNPDGNPVVIRVLRKERVSVPAGTFESIVIQPIIKTKGIFSEDGMAELWLSDDPRRILLQMRSKFSVFTLGLFLKKTTLPPLTPEPAP